MSEHKDEEPYRFWTIENPIAWGLSITCLFIGFVVFLALGTYCDESGKCSRRIFVFLASKPNEIGDTLAGISSTVAFVWIVVTVWIQSHELREQRRELRYQRLEFAKVASSMDEQTRIFEGEEKKRTTNTYFSILNQRIRAILDSFNELNGKLQWVLNDASGSVSSFDLVPAPLQISRKNGEHSVNDSELDGVLDRLESFWAVYMKQKEAISFVEKPVRFRQLIEIKESLDEIMKFIDSLSPSSQDRVATIRLKDRAAILVNALEDQAIWADTGVP